MRELTFTCDNCHNTVTEKVEGVEYEYLTASKAPVYCEGCGRIAVEYYNSAAYRLYEDSETDYRY